MAFAKIANTKIQNYLCCEEQDKVMPQICDNKKLCAENELGEILSAPQTF